MAVYDSSYLAKCALITVREFMRSGKNPGTIKYNMRTLKPSADVKWHKHPRIYAFSQEYHYNIIHLDPSWTGQIKCAKQKEPQEKWYTTVRPYCSRHFSHHLIWKDLFPM